MKRNGKLMMTALLLVTAPWLVTRLAAKGVSVETRARSCADPPPHEVRRCRELEEQVLASTVRLQFIDWDSNASDSESIVYGVVGHATIKEGRLAVTHNHWPIAGLTDPNAEEMVSVSVSTLDAEVIWQGPLAAVSVAVEDAETLVLDFGSQGGEGLFDSLGLPSSEFEAWDSLTLRPGMELAQVDWDGETTRVDWVVIDEVITGDGTPRLELSSFVRTGASGGGVFLDGVHIANNKSQVTVVSASGGAVMRKISVVALNSSEVAAQLEEIQVAEDAAASSTILTSSVEQSDPAGSHSATASGL